MKRIIVIIFLSLLSKFSFAQEKFADRLYFGGNLGLQFGTITSVEVSPLIGYRVTERFSVGTGITYIYYSFQNFKTSIYGGRIFSRFLITDNFFAHTEAELLSLETFDPITFKRVRKNVPGILVGGGYRQAIGARSFVSIMLLYNLNQTPYTPYDNPRFNIGFSFGI